jgi:hypothetical protein
MTKVEMWPPPDDWTEVVIPWTEMLVPFTFRQPLVIIKWIEDQPGGCYHLHGWQATEGFAFRFERAEDATAFALRWK